MSAEIERLKGERRAKVAAMVAEGMTATDAFEACSAITGEIHRLRVEAAPRDHRHAGVERDLRTLASQRMPGIEWPLQ